MEGPLGTGVAWGVVAGPLLRWLTLRFRFRLPVAPALLYAEEMVLLDACTMARVYHYIAMDGSMVLGTVGKLYPSNS